MEKIKRFVLPRFDEFSVFLMAASAIALLFLSQAFRVEVREMIFGGGRGSGTGVAIILILFGSFLLSFFHVLTKANRCLL